ncbi:hypothetical protein MRB53_037722 [Persea americana]|nr:hypothetical protein MRB53_037722 [Persea americana]
MRSLGYFIPGYADVPLWRVTGELRVSQTRWRLKRSSASYLLVKLLQWPESSTKIPGLPCGLLPAWDKKKIMGVSYRACERFYVKHTHTKTGSEEDGKAKGKKEE